MQSCLQTPISLPRQFASFSRLLLRHSARGIMWLFPVIYDCWSKMVRDSSNADVRQPGGAVEKHSRRRGSAAWATIWRIGGAVVVVCLLVILLAMLFENSLIFFPMPYPEGEWHPQGLAFEDAWFDSADGTRLHGWYVPKENARGVVLFCHGNAGNITGRAYILEILHERVGVSTLIFDYRGYGRSEGKPSEAGVLADARASRRWLANREKIAETDVVLMGESIGGAVAVDLAARDGTRRWCSKAPSTTCPTWPPIIIPRFPSAGPCGLASTRKRKSATTTARCCNRTATPTRSCRCSLAGGCLPRPTNRSSFSCTPATITTTRCRLSITTVWRHSGRAERGRPEMTPFRRDESLHHRSVSEIASSGTNSGIPSKIG